MIRIFEIKIKSNKSKDTLKPYIENKLHKGENFVKSFNIVKESLDARKKPEIYKIYTVDIECKEKDEEVLKVLKRLGFKAEIEDPQNDNFLPQNINLGFRPVVAGFGPCGMFAGLALALMGTKPIILERGARMDKRIEAVESFWSGGELNPLANCQFGEGGAGTFSDGKLTTGTKSPYQHFVLKEFVLAGADKDILYKQKPHIGTDVLRGVVVNIRKKIEKLGGEILFETKLENIEIKDGKLCAVVLGNGRKIETKALILALGHSARDSFSMLYDKGLSMQQKQFSMGVRIEHDQDLIDKSQFGDISKNLGLEPADYKLNTKVSNGRGVYTFCMCPGGFVVNASSFPGGICCNGMSNKKRDSGKANSALLCDVRPQDFGSPHPLAGLLFQEKYEQLAYRISENSYKLPTEDLDSFLERNNKQSFVKKCLPEFVYSSICEALPVFGRKIKGFDKAAKIYGVEARSSSPVRILRSEEGLASINNIDILGLYPAGEGAGYAGGIMSAACDGIKVAIKLAEKLK